MKTINLPGSKSISNRNLILCALSKGKSILKGILFSEDTKYMINALKKLGYNISIDDNDDNFSNVIIEGGLNFLNGNNKTLFLGNSGTSTRFLLGLSILNKKGKITITGEKRMLERPIEDLIQGLKQLGGNIQSNKGYLPTITIPSKIGGNNIKLNGNISSQYLTSILQIAPLIPGGVNIEIIGDLVSKPYIDITINEMNKFGIKVENNDYKSFQIKEQKYKNKKGILNIEGDSSSMSYIALYSLLKKKKIFINNLGNYTKQGDYNFLNILKTFGLEYKSDEKTTILNSNGFINNINKTSFDFEMMPDVSMTFMILSLFIKGNTKIKGLKTLNLKESKRITAMKNEIKKLGVNVKSTNHSIIIGEIDLEKIKGLKIKINTYNDHRIAMCFGILNSVLKEKDIELNIENKKCVNKTYPNFWNDLKYLEK